MNDAMRRLEGLVGEWDVTMTHAWFLDSLDSERPGRRSSRSRLPAGPDLGLE